MPDLVSTALNFSAQDLVSSDDHARTLASITAIAKDIVKITMEEVPDSSQQAQRIKVATAHLESLMAATKDINQLLEGGGDISSDTPGLASELTLGGNTNTVLLGIIRDRLLRCDAEYQITRHSTAWCDGSSPDGTMCRKDNSDTEMFTCVYCANVNFCSTCPDLLRHSGSDAIFLCDPRPQWFKCPPIGDNMYVGPNAQSVRRPTVSALDGDKQVLVVSYNADGSEVVSVQAWKEGLAKEWGISMEELNGVQTGQSTPESDD